MRGALRLAVQLLASQEERCPVQLFGFILLLLLLLLLCILFLSLLLKVCNCHVRIGLLLKQPPQFISLFPYPLTSDEKTHRHRPWIVTHKIYLP